MIIEYPKPKYKLDVNGIMCSIKRSVENLPRKLKRRIKSGNNIPLEIESEIEKEIRIPNEVLQEIDNIHEIFNKEFDNA